MHEHPLEKRLQELRRDFDELRRVFCDTMREEGNVYLGHITDKLQQRFDEVSRYILKHQSK